MLMKMLGPSKPNGLIAFFYLLGYQTFSGQIVGNWTEKLYTRYQISLISNENFLEILHFLSKNVPKSDQMRWTAQLV